MGTLAFSDLEPHILDEHFAIALGKYHLTRSKKGGGDADGLFSLVLEKTPAGWKIILDHTGVDAQPVPNPPGAAGPQ